MADTQPEDQPIVAQADPNEPAGVPDGTIIETPKGQPNEKVVNDYDEEGNIIGWHKEAL